MLCSRSPVCTHPIELSTASRHRTPFVAAAPERCGGARSSRSSQRVVNAARASPGDQSQVRSGSRSLVIEPAAQLSESPDRRVKVSGVAPLGSRRHPARQLRQAPFDPVSPKTGIRQRGKWPVAQSASSRNDMCALTPRWSGRAHHKVTNPNVGVRAAQLNR